MINDFSYRLKNSSGLYYKVSGTNLQAIVDIHELEHAPDGWREKSINYKRSIDDWGVIRSFTIPLKFVLDGAEILRFIFYTYGYEGDCILEIMQLNNESYEYEPLFIGDIDFTTFEDSVDFVTVNSIEGGFQKLLKANETTVYEIDIEDEEAINVRLDGINLVSKLRFDVIGSRYTTAGAKLAPLAYILGEGINISLAAAQFVYGQDAPGSYATSDQWLLKSISNEDVTVNISGRISGVAGIDVAAFIPTARIVFSTGTSDDVGTGGTTAATSRLTRWFIDFQDTVVIPAGANAFLEINSSTALEHVSGGTILIDFVNKKPPTIVKGLKAITVFKRLCEKIGGVGTAPLFDNNISVVFLTLGSILNLEDKGKLKITLSDFFKFANTVFSATKYINDDQLVLDKLEEAFNENEVMDIGEVRDLSINLLKEKLFNNVKAGYDTKVYEEVNGKFEFNAKQIWKADVTRIATELDMSCPYRADSYGIEIIRTNLEGKTTTDSTSDNDVFFMHIRAVPTLFTDENEPVYEISREYKATAGVPQTSFNLELSPRMNLMRNARYLTSLLWNTTKILTLQTADKNTDLEANYSPAWVQIEKEALDFATGKGVYPWIRPQFAEPVQPLFTPVLIRFEPLVESSIYEVMKSSPRGKVKFERFGVPFYGFIYEINIEPQTGKTQNWTLLSAPENDLKLLTELNNYYEGIIMQEVNNKKTGFIGDSFEYTFKLSGTPNITISNVVKPAWLTLDITPIGEGRLYGIGGALGVHTISFTATNCAGSVNYSFDIKIFEFIDAFAWSDSGEEVDNVHVFDTFEWINTDDQTEAVIYSEDMKVFHEEVVPAAGNAVTVHNEIPGATYYIYIRRFDGVFYSPYQIIKYVSAVICKSYTLTNTGSRRVYERWIDCAGAEQAQYIEAGQNITFCASKLIQIESQITINGLCP